MTLLMPEREKYREGEIKGTVRTCKNFNLFYKKQFIIFLKIFIRLGITF